MGEAPTSVPACRTAAPSAICQRKSTRTIETVYRHELQPVIRSGAATMNKIFSRG
jgi:hypothetical protein